MERLKRMPFLEIFLLLILNLSFFSCPSQSRDPFYLPQSLKISSKSENIRILGIVESSGVRSAILLTEDGEQTVFEGEKINGFSVNIIKLDRVIFSKGKKRKVLFIEK